MTGIAILGGGFMGMTHAGAWKAQGDRCRVEVVASRTAAKAAKVADAAGGADVVDDLDAAIADPRVSLVDVCLPTPLHREVAERAFAAGKDVLLEKPLALTLEDAEAIVDAAARSGRVLLVGMVLRFWPEYQKLHRLAEEGAIGEVRSVSTLRLSPPADWNEWSIDPAQSGGAAVDLLVHDFDQLNALLGAPRTVAARAVRRGPLGAPQHVLAVTEHEGGSGLAEGSMMLPSSYPFTSNIRVLGASGILEYPFAAAPAVDGGNIGGVDAEANRLRLHPADGDARAIDVASADPWHRQAAYLLDHLDSGTAPELGTGEQALAALRLSLAANRSLERGTVETV
jgi:predicted dehydrogenase